MTNPSTHTAYMRGWRAANPQNREYQRQWWKDHPEAKRRYYATSPYRIKAIKMLGGACNRCGIDDERVLQMDHVWGDGYLERPLTDRGDRFTRDRTTRFRRIYRAIESGSGRYQLLCANCHMIKTREAGEFRHGSRRGTTPSVVPLPLFDDHDDLARHIAALLEAI